MNYLDSKRPCVLISLPVGCLGCGEGSKGALPLEQQFNGLQSALAAVNCVPTGYRATSIQQGLLEIAIEKAQEKVTENPAEKPTEDFDLVA